MYEYKATVTNVVDGDTKGMNLRKAAQQALEALEVWRDSLTDPSAIPGWRFSVVGEKAVANLRAALTEDAMQRLTDVQQEMEPTCQAPQQVEPVAYVTGYSKGRCIIEAVDPDWLLPVGMALYRSPPTINEMETVEPVAWLQIGIGDHEGTMIATTSKPKTWNPDWWRFEPLYNAPPKRKPLTEESLENLFLGNDSNDWWRLELKEFVNVARAIERAYGIGGEE